jgi:transcriptional regulator GlxA family with amidase domain
MLAHDGPTDHLTTEGIHRRRVNKASTFLLNSDMTIEEIATACGFNDSDYFRPIFRRYKHITPIHFRNTNAGIHINTH